LQIKYQKNSTMPAFSFIILMLLLAQAKTILGYAAWLKCFIDLDGSEVIMNYNVVAAEDSPHHVRILPIRTDSPTDDKTAAWTTTKSINYAAGIETRWNLTLAVPEDLAKLDVQYVMETSDGAQFATRRMCEGRRSHGKAYDAATVLVVDGSQAQVEVWAGWATGHSAVHLTEKLVFHRAAPQSGGGGGEL
jgi:hypothetical protein